MTPPIYCARGSNEHLAAWHVDAPGRHEVVCQNHLDASVKWAGPDAELTPVEQPPDIAPPVQPALF